MTDRKTWGHVETVHCPNCGASLAAYIEPHDAAMGAVVVACQPWNADDEVQTDADPTYCKRDVVVEWTRTFSTTCRLIEKKEE